MRAALLLVLLAGTARAETLAYVEAGAEALHGRGYALVEPGLELRGDGLHLALGALFRLNGEGLRDGDLDEASEYAAVLRRLEIGEDGEALRLVAGSVPAITLGRGTIVSGLAPSLDPDHGRAGVYFRFAQGGFAFSAMSQDVTALRVLGARLEWAPASRVLLGGTWAADPEAEVALPTGGVGTDPAQVVGLDLTVVAVRERGFSLAPYVEGAGLVGSGAGVTLGLGADVELGGGTLAVSAELRRSGEGHVPRYFDAFYEVERHAWPRVRSAPKLSAARSIPAGTGGAGEVRWTAGAWAFHAGIEGREGGPVALDLGLDLTAGDLSLAARAARRGAVDLGDLGDLSGELWALAEARYAISGPVYAFATAWQLYHLEDGRPRPITEGSIGLGLIGGR